MKIKESARKTISRVNRRLLRISDARETDQIPLAANPSSPASLTPAQFQEWSYVVKQSGGKKWFVYTVLAAGVGSVLDIIHLSWLLGKWVYYFLK